MSESPLLHITSAAEQDIAEAMTWYDDQYLGLGNEFLLGLEATFASILRNAQQYPLIHRRVRRALLRRFPYSIFFFVEGETIIILAVFHVRRNPREWQSRL